MVCLGGRCPSAQLLDQYQPRQTSKLFSSDGRFIAELGLERRTLVKLADVPKQVQDAFVTTEDRRFYQHAGVDWESVPRAVVRDLRSGDWSEGFSTITMQLARNIFPERISREKSLVRKLKEIKVAREIEQRYPKGRILELYLNQIYFGNGAYGVETASQRYFGKSVRELNLAEGATLASIPKSPTRYNPRKSPEAVVQRRNSVLELMRQASVVSEADASLAKAYPLRLAEKTETGDVAPYFVEYVRQQLDEKFGAQLYEQGLNVYTTLDVDMQSAAERALEHQLSAVEGGKFGAYHWPTYEAYVANAKAGDDESSTSPYLQGAFIAMDPRTGGIRALVGGRDFDDNKFDRATQALRQPGSTFKPIVYADAVQNGRPMSYLLDDSPLDVPMGDGTTWHPQNFDGQFQGRIPLRRGLYESRNVATIRLGIELGEQSVIDMARKFGLTSELPAYPSMFIGADEVYPIEMVAAYGLSTLGARGAQATICEGGERNGGSAVGTRGRSCAGDVAGGGVADGQRDEGCRGARHRRGHGRRADPFSGRWKNRHHERRVRCLVHRVHHGSGGGRLDGVRPAEEDQIQRAGWRARRPSVGDVHERGLSSAAAADRLAHPGEHRHAQHRFDDQYVGVPVLPSERCGV